MLMTLAQLPPDRIWDVAVVGSGPAGMTAAVALARLGRDVLLLEGGDRDYTDQSQSQYQGEVIGDPYFELDGCRLRMLGGTSFHWSGWCRPFEADDFDRRDVDSMAWWPIDRSDLDPYRNTAAALLTVPDDFWSRDIEDGLCQFQFQVTATPTRFGAHYFEEIRGSSRITLALNSNLVGMATEEGRVVGLEMASYQAERRMVRARTYVLACGGIENSRLLMHFNRATKGQLIKVPATLGRYWMEHPHFDIGTGLVPRYERPSNYFRFQPAELRRRGLLNCGLRVHRTHGGERRDQLASLLCTAPRLAEPLFDLFRSDLSCTVRLRAAWEQAPRADNRIELDQSDPDIMGIGRVKLHWTKTDADLANMRELALAYGAHLVRQDAGRIQLAPWVFGKADYPSGDETAGYHHIGGTRMSDKPETGIVDSNLKVFGQDNLYVAGSSVFPTGGHVNPTMTIVQLSMRLADHLNQTALKH